MTNTRRPAPRGYALMVVVVAAVLLAAIGMALLVNATRDRTEASQQMNSVRALFAAEGAVVAGVDGVRELLRTNPGPTSTELHAIPPPPMKSAVIPAADFQIDYVDPDDNFSVVSPGPPAMTLTPLTSGIFRGLNAQQLPIQVMATAVVDHASATISDIVRVELIPIFQFGVFFDQPIEFYLPEESAWTGRVHSNGGIYFGNGADDISFDGRITTAGRVWLRELGGASSQVNGRSPRINGVDQALLCDDAESGALGCPGGASWLAWSKSKVPGVEDQAHGVTEVILPTGTSDESFTHPDTGSSKVLSVPDLCGIEPESGTLVPGSGHGAPLSANWQLIDIPRDDDTAALKNVKYAHRASIRVVDGRWFKRTSSGSYVAWFTQGDGSPESSCLYYGYDPATDSGLPDSDGVPAIRDVRFWDHQDRALRRVVEVDVHRLTRCLPELELIGFNGVLYFGETLNAPVDNWGLSPDERFYTLAGGDCRPEVLKLPHYLRGQLASSIPGFSASGMPDYLKNDDVTLAPAAVRLDNPYYPPSTHCAPDGGTRVKALGDGPWRLPQGNGNGAVEPGRNELVETGVMLTNAARLPTVIVDGKPQGFTFATNAPLYLQGDFNVKTGSYSASCATTGTYPSCPGYQKGKVPASVAGDAMTFLSSKFNALQENPFAPTGPLAVMQALSAAGATSPADLDGGGVGVVDAQQIGTTRRKWTRLRMADPASAPALGSRKRFDTDYVATGGTKPASPAPCVNLLREEILRRALSSTAGLPSTFDGNCGDPDGACGLHGLTNQNGATASLAFGADWLVDGSGLELRADTLAPTSTLREGDRLRGWVRASNALVAFAPLEAFLDVSLYQRASPSEPGFASRKTPSLHTDREALRDWMRCTLNSQHALVADGSGDSIRYGGARAPTVIIGTSASDAQPQPYASGDPEHGMKAAGGADFNVTYGNILGHDGFAPLDEGARFETPGGAPLFTRDRSSLVDPNGANTPAAVASTLGNLAHAAAGDQLALNVSILAGTSWRCPTGAPYPTPGAGYALPDSADVAPGPGSLWWVTGIDEGLYGMFRYQESWWELDRSAAASSSNGEYIDFFIHGSVIALFYSPASAGRHLSNQGFVPNEIAACNGQDNNQRKNRTCRLDPGYEYAWESSRRSITYDVANDTPEGLPPGVPMVVNTTRLRWVRR